MTSDRARDVLVASTSRTSVLEAGSIVVCSGRLLDPLNNRVIGTLPVIGTGVTVSAPLSRVTLSSTASRDEFLRQFSDRSWNEASHPLADGSAGNLEATPLSMLSLSRMANEEAPASLGYATTVTPEAKEVSEAGLVDIQAIISTAAQCYHAHDYASVISLLQVIPLDEYSNIQAKFIIASYVGQGLAHYKSKHYNDATSYFLKALKATEDAGWTADVSFINFYLAELEYAQNNFLSAANYFAHAVQLHSTSRVGKMFAVDIPSKAIVYCKQATALRYGSKMIDSIQTYKRSIAIAKSLSSKKDELTARTSLGNLFQGIGENSRAVDEYLETIKLADGLRDYVSLGLAEGNLGNAYLALHKRDSALKHLRISLDLALSHDPTPQAIGRAYNNLGTAYQALGELEQAKDYYDLALSQAVYGNDHPGQARVYGNIGNLLMLQHRHTEAILHYSETLSISRDRATQTTAYHNRGCARYERAEVERKQFLEGDCTSHIELLAQGKSVITFVGNGMNDCEEEYRFLLLPESLLKQYRDAKRDLEKVMKHHEQTFRDIKGSPQGLSLSVSLFETNSSTFQRLQDCSYFLGEWQQALVIAEQSRSRTLGELMLEHKQGQLKSKFRTPLELSQLVSIAQLQEMPVVYLSYTGTRLLVWVLVPGKGSMDADINLFQVTLDPSQFNDRSFEHLLKYTLPESLIDERLDMFSNCNYHQQTLLTRLHDLIAKPMLTIFKSVLAPEALSELHDVVLIPDSHTKLMPMAALHNPDTDQFLGDRIRFHTMHSLLTYGILSQLPSVMVNIPLDSTDMCIVGNPVIPYFKHQGEEWNLGRLPFATEEAEWVSHILQAKPTLHEEATKQVVLSKLIKAKVVHLATHGSASAGFLVFAGVSSFTGLSDGFDANSLLLHPEEVESLSLPAALVVLSSCDSGRGALKAEGIQGIARSFLLAGAQAVLTSLWRVPDESASLFMQFFYRYLVDGFRSFQALQKAMLSLRCYLKYSEYIHWSGYQLMGREVRFCSNPDTIWRSMGSISVFPQLVQVLEIRKVLTANASSPTLSSLSYSTTDWKFTDQISSKVDIQLLLGSPATCPMELAKDYIAKYHHHYSGGVYWVSGWCRELISSSVESITQALVPPMEEIPEDHYSEEVLLVQISATSEPILLILDQISMLPLQCSALTAVMQKSDVHIIICSGFTIHPDGVSKPAHEKLFRGCSVKYLYPLNQLQVTQRLIYPIISAHNFFPMNDEQAFFHELASLVGGSPAIVALTSAVMLCCIDESNGSVKDGLNAFRKSVILPISDSCQDGDRGCPAPTELVMFHLLQTLKLSVSQQLLLTCLSVLQGAPVHQLVLSTLEKVLYDYSGCSDLRERLQHTSLLVQYPSPVVKPAGRDVSDEQLNLFYQVPPTVAQSFWLVMDRRDRAIAVALLSEAVQELSRNTPVSDEPLVLHVTGLRSLISQAVGSDHQSFTLGAFNECFSNYVSDKKKSTSALIDLQADILVVETGINHPINTTSNP